MAARTIGGVEVLPPGREYQARQFAIWMARHPAEVEALTAAGLGPVAGTLWNDCWELSAWDTTRRVRQLRGFLYRMFRRFQQLAMGLEDEPDGGWDAIRANQRLGLYATEAVARMQELGERLEAARVRAELDEEVEDLSAYWRSGA